MKKISAVSPDFWDKVIESQAAKAGKELVEKGVGALSYTWDDDDTPMWAKATIVGAKDWDFISQLFLYLR